MPLQQWPHLPPVETAAATTGTGQDHLLPTQVIGQMDQFSTGTLDKAQIWNLEWTVFHRKVEQTVSEMKDVVPFVANELTKPRR